MSTAAQRLIAAFTVALLVAPTAAGASLGVHVAMAHHGHYSHHVGDHPEGHDSAWVASEQAPPTPGYHHEFEAENPLDSTAEHHHEPILDERSPVLKSPPMIGVISEPVASTREAPSTAGVLRAPPIVLTAPPQLFTAHCSLLL